MVKLYAFFLLTLLILAADFSLSLSADQNQDAVGDEGIGANSHKMRGVFKTTGQCKESHRMICIRDFCKYKGTIIKMAKIFTFFLLTLLILGANSSLSLSAANQNRDVGGDEVKGENCKCEKDYTINPLCEDTQCNKYCCEKHPSNHIIGICIDHLTCQCKFTCN
ncbi:hypothetical protein POM88_048917 [Heracleum sosnowskyi]|uniref:Defensin-like protein n=1 Tax=Heracleum sosnowskyi TaxID=360622 RepID=A0AAD8GX85_9APIA|nr:hypothetical protein POM88_048917 [Heracleum sosnowskyi]